MNSNLHAIYLFDPLCGWCWGASDGVQRLAAMSGVTLELAPTGLFSGAGARAMDSGLAQFAWSNDQRIAKVSGQTFSDAYRSQVLDKHGSRFDSGPATLALTAVALTTPARQLDALKAIQQARYVQGLDTTAVAVLQSVLNDLNLQEAAALLGEGGASLQAASQARTAKARKLTQTFGAQGVPALIVSDDRGQRLVSGNALYLSTDGFLAHLHGG